MMVVILSSIALLFGACFALVSALSREVERLLWGSIFCSLGLGFAVIFAGGSYFGVLMSIIFLTVDLLFYFYLRSIFISQLQVKSSFRRTKVSNIFVLWLAICLLILVVIAIQKLFIAASEGLSLVSSISELENKAWGNDFILLFICFFILISISVGGFFLVRGNRTK